MCECRGQHADHDALANRRCGSPDAPRAALSRCLLRRPGWGRSVARRAPTGRNTVYATRLHTSALNAGEQARTRTIHANLRADP